MSLTKAKQVAEQLGCSIALVRKLARDGKIPHVRVSTRTLRFQPEELAEFINERTMKMKKNL
jgi:excisionase family DNA binding protein